ncbi:hypothetical protein [Serratia nevei]|uniref:hypothetical protein n=1 Tax=Serratia nevei TaxID=2703794 RepID=UPI003FA73102
MGRQTHIGYHNCRDDGGYEYLRQHVPFLSGNGENQWLTQGYYFWTDSPYWAEKWNSKHQTAISEFTISFHNDEELLDLVGNSRHIHEFGRMRQKVADSLKMKDLSKVTVNQIIGYFRKIERSRSGFFPYLAVKAQDSTKDDAFSVMRFVKAWYRKETLACHTRQQLCVFSHARDRITLNGFLSPETYRDQ